MNNLMLTPIGQVLVDENGFQLQIYKEYRKALTGLSGFSSLLMVWWFDQCDTKKSREKLVEQKPYRNGPELLGTFATRSPERPNPIAISVVNILSLDIAQGILTLSYTDAFHGTPILDLKPYIPSLDRVETPSVPDWCSNWPDCVERSGNFDWSQVFNF